MTLPKKPPVKCPKCGITFDRDEEPCVKIKNRYWHVKCAEEKDKEEEPDFTPIPKPKSTPTPLKIPEKDLPAYRALTDYVNKKLNGDVNWGVVGQQIKNFRDKEEYTFSGMLKTLRFYCEVRGGTLSKKSGISIIKYVYSDAYEYYKKVYESHQNSEQKILVVKEKKIEIEPPQKRGLRIKIFDLGESE